VGYRLRVARNGESWSPADVAKGDAGP